LELSSYNGWENKFTWLVHLHLSNEQAIAHEMAAMVGSEPNYCPASRLVEMWMKSALTNWYTCFPGRNRQYDEHIRLLVWDLVGSALAYADGDVLVALLAGERVQHDNLFTWTLYRCILNDSQLYRPVQGFMRDAPSAFVCADAIKEWFRVQVDAWVDLPATQRQRNCQ